MTDAGAALYGRAWVNHPPRPKKEARTPIFTEQRGTSRWDALDPADAARIREQAKLEAAAVMKNWERKTGR